MKLIVNKANIPGHPEHFLRQAGYGFIRDSRRDKESFVRRLGSGFYPRLHMYVEYLGNDVVFDLHLDQKQASYAGARMHNAEHDGEIVENEIARLKSLLSYNVQHITRNDVQSHSSHPASRNSQSKSNPPNSLYQGGNNKELIDKIGGDRDYANFKPEQEKKKSWWRFFS